MIRGNKPSQRPFIIPIFVPHMGCPHHCVFCNQTSITGAGPNITMSSIAERIIDQLRVQPGNSVRRQIAFYGGSFTAMDRTLQTQLLSAVQPFIRKGVIDSVRISTRPDYIDLQTLDLLQEYGVRTVELGVQSMVEEVLRCSYGRSGDPAQPPFHQDLPHGGPQRDTSGKMVSLRAV
jgi:histone acetyltransferase (RNA polymerase elongator complex component)